MSTPTHCTVSQCDTTVKARGYCTRHYQRWLTHGDVHHNRFPPMPERFWAKVDKSGDCWEWTASKAGNGYGQFNPGGRSAPMPAHRVAWELTRGPIPESLLLDHICFNIICVNPQHLRIATTQLNNEYRHRGNKKIASSGFRGVYRAGDRWIARVVHEGVHYNLGRYDDKEEAGGAAAAKREELFQFPEFQGATS